jgi:hypothetical protein
MSAKKIYVVLIWIEAIYTLLTALWGLIDIDSFMQVTGPKTDVWLVKTVSVLLLPIAICFISGIYLKQNPLTIILVGLTTSVGLAAIDFYYTANDTIRFVYAIDGSLQLLFFTCWTYLLIMIRRL